MIEEWKDIKGYEGIYMASNLGRVKSFKLGREKILSGGLNRHGYLRVVLYKDKKAKTFPIHKLVAMAFLDHTPDRFNSIVDHIDNDRLNNKLSNLQITTMRHNVSKDMDMGSSKYVGVCWHKPTNRWRARIYSNGKRKSLGSFPCEFAAAVAYKKELKNINDKENT